MAQRREPLPIHPGSVPVPIEIQFPKGKPMVHWVRTVNGSAPFSVAVRQAPSKVILDPHNSVLRK